MASKKAATKAPAKPKFVKLVGARPRIVFDADRDGDSPVIIDDGGCTRIRKVFDTLDTLLPPPAGTGTATVDSKLKAASIRYINFDTNGETQSTKIVIAKTPAQINAIEHIDVKTDTAVSLTVTLGSVTTELVLTGGVTVKTEDDNATNQRSYLGSDTGAISSISVTGTNGLVTAYDTSGAVYVMLHLKFR